MKETISLPLGLLWPFAFGAVLSWTIRVAHSGRTNRKEETLLQVLEIIGWLLMFGSAIGILLAVFEFLSWFCFAIIAVVSLLCVQRYRDSEKQALIHTLTMAAEQGIPLGETVRAFASEKRNAYSHRVIDLAELLEAGVPLPSAIEQARLRLPSETALAVHVGSDTGHLGMALRESLTWTSVSNTVLASLLEKLFYVLLILGVGFLLLYWLFEDLGLMFQEMAVEFGAKPTVSAMIWQFVEDLRNQSAVIWLQIFGVMTAGALIACIFLCVCFYLRWISTDLPVVRWLWFPWERTIVLHALATAVRNRQPLTESLRQLQTHHPKRSMRRRLERAFRVANVGGDWRQGLLKARLINRREAAVLQAAEQLDNVAWALREMADRRLQRTLLRVHRSLSILVPLVMTITGLLAVTIGVAYLDMLASAIRAAEAM
jgi:type II secretory pathway component PulF